MTIPVRIRRITTPPPAMGDGGLGDIASAYSSAAASANDLAKVQRQREEQAGIEEAQADFEEAALNTPDGEMVVTPLRDGGLLDFLGVRDEAYANAVQVLTIQRAESDGAARLSELADIHKLSPTQYEEEAGNFIKGYISQAPAESRREIELKLGQMARKGLGAVRANRRDADLKESRKGLDAKISTLADDLDEILIAAGPTATQSEEYAAIEQEITALYDLKANNPAYGYSEEEKERDLDELATRLEISALTPEIEAVFAQEGYANALEAADRLTEEIGRDRASQVKLRSQLRNQVNLLQQNRSAFLAEEREKEAAREKMLKELRQAEERKIIDMLYSETVTKSDKLAAVRARRDLLTPSRYESLLSAATSDTVTLGPNAVAGLEIEALNGALTRDDVAELPVDRASMNRLLGAVAKSESAAQKAAKTVFDGAFTQGDLFTIDQNLKAMEQQAQIEFDRWLESQENATVEQARQRAIEITADLGRTAMIPAYSNYLKGTTQEDFDAAFMALDRETALTENERADEALKLERAQKWMGQ